jgi:hypothetical protein
MTESSTEEQFAGALEQLIERQGAMAGVGGFEEDMIEAGGGAQQGIERHAEFLGDLVGGFEADAGMSRARM